MNVVLNGFSTNIFRVRKDAESGSAAPLTKIKISIAMQREPLQVGVAVGPAITHSQLLPHKEVGCRAT